MDGPLCRVYLGVRVGCSNAVSGSAAYGGRAGVSDCPVCAAAAGISGIVCPNVLTLDLRDTIPPSTTAIDSIIAT
jgi:hypothetical protein